MNTRRPRRCLLLVTVALGVAAPSAAASATSMPGRADAGPAIVGGSVLWAESSPDGSSVIKRDGAVIESVPAPAPAEGLDGRHIAGLAASATRLVYIRADTSLEDQETNTQSDEDFFSSWVSMDGGAFTNPMGCSTPTLQSVDVDADTVAIGSYESGGSCTGINVNGKPFGFATYVSEVRVAGPYVAWIDYGEGTGLGAIKVANLATGNTIASFPSHRRDWETFDIDAQGNIAAVISGSSLKLLAFSLKHHKQRVLSSHPSADYVATAGGRVAYISTDSKNRLRALNLTDLKGKLLQRLDRYSATRRPSGDIALTGDRVAWSVGGNVLTEALGAS